MKREHNDRAWLAWHTAFLTAYAPKKSKDFVKLQSLLHGGKAKAEAKAVTPAQQNQAIKMLHLMFGGTLEEIRKAENGEIGSDRRAEG